MCFVFLNRVVVLKRDIMHIQCTCVYITCTCMYGCIMCACARKLLWLAFCVLCTCIDNCGGILVYRLYMYMLLVSFDLFLKLFPLSLFPLFSC